MADPIVGALEIVNHALREVFPADFYKRCMYAAIASATLLEEAGVRANVVGGDFLCLMASADGRQMNGQGFGVSAGSAISHYWVVADGQTIDLGPWFLVHESKFPAVQPPIVRWAVDQPLPGFLVYRERAHFSHDTPLDDEVIQVRLDLFLAHCRAIRNSGRAAGKLHHWMLRDLASLRSAALLRDPWAMAATFFHGKGMQLAIPF